MVFSASAADALEKVQLIHYKDGKHEIRGNTAKATTKGGMCYSVGYWIKTPVEYYINPYYSPLENPFIRQSISASADTWDVATRTQLFMPYGVTEVPGNDFDGMNTIYFGYIPEPTVIAATTFWYYTKSKEIVEWDIEMSTQFTWGDATVGPTVMDVQNIATHELGHTLGLNDIYKQECAAVTMFGYSDEGDTALRTLERSDIQGLQRIYGK